MSATALAYEPTPKPTPGAITQLDAAKAESVSAVSTPVLPSLSSWERYGTLILTLALVGMKVMMVAALMLTGNPKPTMARDTVFAVQMMTHCILLLPRWTRSSTNIASQSVKLRAAWTQQHIESYHRNGRASPGRVLRLPSPKAIPSHLNRDPVQP